jgi:hypothetical protein
MKLSLLAAPLASFGLTVSALAGNAITGVIAVPFQAQRATAIALVQPADYVCATVSISSREKDPARQTEDVRAAVRQLSSAVAKSPLLQLHEGPLRFYAGARNDNSFTGHLLSFSSSPGSSYGNFSLFATSVRVLYKLDGSGSDTFTAATALRKLVDEIKVSHLTDLRLSQLTLAVEAPERQRERLLSLIRESADAMKKTFSADQVTVGGLDGPVLVRQVDDASVELFIDYTLSVTTGK